MNGPELVEKLGGSWHGSHGTAPCPAHVDHNPSLSIKETIEDKRRDGVEFVEAVETLEGARLERKLERQLPPPPRTTGSFDLDRVSDLWASGVDARDTLVETYLKSREPSVDIRPPRSLRFHPSLSYWDRGELVGKFPAMLAAVQSSAGAIVACHRTYLALDGRGKAPVPSARKLLGSPRGGAIRFARPAHKVAIAEGIETALRIVESVPGLAVWSAISVGGMASLAFPTEVKEVVFCADKDPSGVGQRGARTAAKIMAARGLTAYWTLPIEVD